MRSFTVETAKKTRGKTRIFTGGRYISETPIGAVKKAFSQIHQTNNSVTSAIIVIRETTRDSKKKQYTYRVTKKAHKTIVEIDGQEIVFYYTTKVKSI